MPPLSPLQKNLLTLAKVTLAVVILFVLFQRIQSESGFQRLLNEPKHWGSLIFAQLLVLVAFSLSFVRWYMLVRGLDLDFHLTDAFRLGTLGFMLNQVSPGSLGGDFLKAVFIAREQHGKRTEAVATVLIDRVIGFLAMLIIASIGLFLAADKFESPNLVRTLKVSVWPATIVGILGLAFVLSPLATFKRIRSLADKLPVVGHTITRLIEAADVYRSRRSYIFAGLGLSFVTHCLLITAFWSVSRGLPVTGPSFIENASLVPLGLTVGAVLPTPGGLGGMEGAIEFLYTSIGAAKGDGTLVALAYRAMTYVFAAIGAFYYFSSRKKVDDLIHEAEALAEEAA